MGLNSVWSLDVTGLVASTTFPKGLCMAEHSDMPFPFAVFTCMIRSIRNRDFISCRT